VTVPHPFLDFEALNADQGDAHRRARKGGGGKKRKKKQKTKKKTKKKNHSTQDSRVVPHRGTNWAALWLTAQIGRDAVLSESYGRGW
jgi:hypothetical protein